METCLQPQLKNADEIRDILKEVSISFKLDDGRDVETLLVYLPSQNGKSDHSEFFEKIKESILYNFVFSCFEVERKLGVKSRYSPEKLFDKAVRKLSQHTAKGELGELILFILLEIYFEAPKLLSKISLKTNRKMPVFGADAVHGQFHDGKFILYLGESKLYKKFKGAATDATKSIKTAKDKYEEEFDLLDTHIDFPEIDKKLEEKLLDFLNPFSDNDLSEVIKSPCFIGFAEPELISSAASEGDFIKGYKEIASEYIGDFYQKLDSQGIGIDETALLMLPFTCADHLVEEFIDYIGIKA